MCVLEHLSSETSLMGMFYCRAMEQILYLEDGQIDKHLEQTEQQLLQQSNFWGINFQKGMVIGIEHALLQPDA